MNIKDLSIQEISLIAHALTRLPKEQLCFESGLDPVETVNALNNIHDQIERSFKEWRAN